MKGIGSGVGARNKGIVAVLLLLLLAGCAGAPTQTTSAPAATPAPATLAPTPAEIHEGAISLSGSQTMVIEGNNLVQVGNIDIKDSARLAIINSSVIVKKQGPRAEITLSGNAKLELVNSRLIPPLEDPANLYFTASGSSSVITSNSTFYNVLNFVGSATFSIQNGSIIHSGRDILEEDGAFGIVQVCCAVKGEIRNSEVGSIGFFYGPDERAVLENMKPGLVARFSNANIVVENSVVLPPKKNGPFERGWSVFADENSIVTIRNSELNKFNFHEIRDKTVEFNGLKTEQSTNLSFARMKLENVNVYNQWGFFLRSSNATISDSDGVRLFLFESGTTKLARSTMNEFDPRSFTGELVFEDGKWITAGEILENNDFTISGNYETDEDLWRSLVWDSSSKVRRVFPGGSAIEFNFQNYKARHEITYNGRKYYVDFFTDMSLR